MGTGASSKVGLPPLSPTQESPGIPLYSQIQKVWDSQLCPGSGPQPRPRTLDLRKRGTPTLHVQSQLLCFCLWGQPGSEAGLMGGFAFCWGKPLATWASSRGAEALGLETCPEDAETPVTQQMLPSRHPGPPTARFFGDGLSDMGVLGVFFHFPEGTDTHRYSFRVQGSRSAGHRWRA